MQQYYQVDWRDARLYDVVINTDRVDVDAAARMIALLEPVAGGAT
jgi:cytidylate kinase